MKGGPRYFRDDDGKQSVSAFNGKYESLMALDEIDKCES